MNFEFNFEHFQNMIFRLSQKLTLYAFLFRLHSHIHSETLISKPAHFHTFFFNYSYDCSVLNTIIFSEKKKKNIFLKIHIKNFRIYK